MHVIRRWGSVILLSRILSTATGAYVPKPPPLPEPQFDIHQFGTVYARTVSYAIDNILSTRGSTKGGAQSGAGTEGNSAPALFEMVRPAAVACRRAYQVFVDRWHEHVFGGWLLSLSRSLKAAHKKLAEDVVREWGDCARSRERVHLGEAWRVLYEKSTIERSRIEAVLGRWVLNYKTVEMMQRLFFAVEGLLWDLRGTSECSVDNLVELFAGLNAALVQFLGATEKPRQAVISRLLTWYFSEKASCLIAAYGQMPKHVAADFAEFFLVDFPKAFVRLRTRGFLYAARAVHESLVQLHKIVVRKHDRSVPKVSFLTFIQRMYDEYAELTGKSLMKQVAGFVGGYSAALNDPHKFSGDFELGDETAVVGELRCKLLEIEKIFNELQQKTVVESPILMVVRYTEPLEADDELLAKEKPPVSWRFKMNKLVQEDQYESTLISEESLATIFLDIFGWISCGLLCFFVFGAVAMRVQKKRVYV